MPPPLLLYLKQLGLSHQRIASALGVTKHTVSNWWTDRRSISSPHLEDLHELITVIQERMAAGKTAAAAIETFHPTTIDNDSGGITRTPGARLVLTPEEQDESIHTHDPRRIKEIFLGAAVRQLAEVAAGPMTAEHLMKLRRLALTVAMTIEWLQWDASTPLSGGD